METRSDNPFPQIALIVTLILLVMLSMTLGLAAYMNWREVSNLLNQMEARQHEVPKLIKSLKNQDDQIQELSKSAADFRKEKIRLEERIAELEEMLNRQKAESDSK